MPLTIELETADAGYYGSFAVAHEEGQVESGVVKTAARSYEEAVGILYLSISEQYPAEEGYAAPDIKVDEQPVILAREVGAPLSIIGEDEDEDDPIDELAADLVARVNEALALVVPGSDLDARFGDRFDDCVDGGLMDEVGGGGYRLTESGEAAVLAHVGL